MQSVFVLSAVAVILSQSPDTLKAVKVSAERDASVSSSAPLRTVSRAEIERRGAVSLAEVLRTMPGANVRDYGGIGGLKTVSVRNLGAHHTAVCFDGNVLSDAQNGQVDLSRFDLEGLSEMKLEVLGSDDIFRSARSMNSAALLSLNRAAPASNSVTARLRAGSFGTWNPYARVERVLRDSSYLRASGNWLGSRGDYPFLLRNGIEESMERRLGSEVSSGGADIDFGRVFSDGGELTARANGYWSSRGLPGSVVLYTQNPTEHLWDRTASGVLSYGNSWGRIRMRTSAAYNYSWNRYTDESPKYQTMEDDRYTQREASLSTVVQYGEGCRFSMSLADDFFVNALESNIPECCFPLRFSGVSALSARYGGDRLKVTGSLVATAVHETVRSGSAADDIFRLSPSLCTSFLLSDGIRLRASYKDGFRVPTFNDLYYARVGNSGLLPEKARQFDIGVTFGRGTLSLTADLYHNSVKDKIIAVPTMFIWKMRNLGEVNIDGAEFSASYIWKLGAAGRLHMNGNLSYQHAVDVTDPSAKNYGHQIQYTPRCNGNALISLDTAWGVLTYTLNAVGTRYALPQNIPANAIPAYADHSLSASREFSLKSCKLRLSLDALNLAGLNYEIVRYYPMPGRNYRMSIKFTI